MNNLSILDNKHLTITSVELVEIINQFRILEDNKSELRHDNFMQKIREELSVLESLGIRGEQNFKQSSYINSQNKQQPCFELNRDDVKHIIDITKSKDRIPMQKIYEDMGGDYSQVICIDRFETTFFNKLKDTLIAMDIELETQKKVLHYKLDGYVEKYNLAIEYDEAQHFTKPQKTKDIERQKEIENKFGYDFIRLNYQNSDAFNIGLVINEIVRRMMLKNE